MEVKTEEVKKTWVSEEAPCGSTVMAEIDHYASDGVFKIEFGVTAFQWIDLDDLVVLKKVINKAIQVYKG